MRKNPIRHLAWILIAGGTLFQACSGEEKHQESERVSTTSSLCTDSVMKTQDAFLERYHKLKMENDSNKTKALLDSIRPFAEKGCTASQYELGLDLVGRDNEKALSWLNIAAKNGNTHAHFKLYAIYSEGVWNDSKGIQIERDSAKAENHFQQTIAQNYAPALVAAAKRKYHEAFVLFQKAADSGSLEGIAYLAHAYESGTGVEDELWILQEKAYLYNSIGAKLAAPAEGCHDFLEEVSQYEKSKSEKNVANLRQSVDHWFDKHPRLKAKLKDVGTCR